MPLLGEFTQNCRCRGFPSQVDVLHHRKSLMERSGFFKTDSFKFHQAAPEGPGEGVDSSRRGGEELAWHQLRPWLMTKSNRVEPLFIYHPSALLYITLVPV